MTHLTNDAIRDSLKKRGLSDEKVDTMEFGEIKEYVYFLPYIWLITEYTSHLVSNRVSKMIWDF